MYLHVGTAKGRVIVRYIRVNVHETQLLTILLVGPGPQETMHSLQQL